jgi:hypothetical protein
MNSLRPGSSQKALEESGIESTRRGNEVLSEKNTAAFLEFEVNNTIT